MTSQYQFNTDDDKVIAREVVGDAFECKESSLYGAGKLWKNIVMNETSEYYR